MERKRRGVRRGKRQVGLSSWGRAAAHLSHVTPAFARTAQRARRGRTGVAVLAATVLVLALAIASAPALADFPYVGDGAPANPASWALAPGHVPTNLGGLGWKFAATPATPPSDPTENLSVTQLNSQQDELCGVTGMSLVDAHATFPSGTGSCIAAGSPVKTGFEVSLGRPDVAIAELDSGILWNDAGDMLQLRKKVLLNPGELPAPQVDLGKTFDASTGVDCEAAQPATGGDYNPHGGMPGGEPGGSGPIPYDVSGQGVFNTLSYACDSRVAHVVQTYPRCTNPPTTSACRNGPAGLLTPEDLIIAFSDGADHDGNSYANDIAGWNYVDNNNDPFDDVQYGHGTGESEDSSAEANVSAGEVGTCPNCTVLPLRVGESFVADANRFAEATIYATDRGVSVVQEALGTYNDPVFARQAIDYAYNHGVTVIASAADEAAEHHNQPGALPHTVVVNAIEGPAEIEGVPVTNHPPSYLQLDGCTNFGTRITLSVPATSCSSEATGKSAGVAGLIYSAALNACGAPLYGHCGGSPGAKLPASKDCTRVDGSACAITANEVRQLMASGNIAGTTVNSSSTIASNPPSTGTAAADMGEGGQADDIDTALKPETACSVGMAPGCTDPNLNTIFATDEQAGVEGPLPDTFRYPSRKGFDEFFGYGRIDAYKSVNAAAQGWVPPEADITSPEWFDQINPAAPSFAVNGYVSARTKYTCSVEIAPGAQPNNAGSASGGDFVAVPSTFCNGTTKHTFPHKGLLATVSTATLASLFPHGDPVSFTGNENGGLAQSSNGRPNTLPYAFTLRVVVKSAAGTPAPTMSGEDRRQMFLHRDQSMLSGFPIEMRGDGDASPVLADLVGDDSNQLIVANSDGWIHAYRYTPSTGKVKDLPGWPVHTEQLPLHTGERAFTSAELSSAHYDAVLEAPAVGDLFGDGRKEVVVSDLEGNVYAWDATGSLVFHKTSNPSYSGAPLAGDPAWEAQRAGTRQRTERGFLTSPVLAKIDPAAGRGLDIIAAGEDRHVYAWHADGTPVGGFPVLVEDPDKVASVDAASNQMAFNSNAKANPGKDEDQGKIVDTPAVAYLDGPDSPPSIIVGSNEEYLTGTGNEGQINASNVTTGSLGVLGTVLKFANGRVYAIKASGSSSDPSAAATGGFSCSESHCTSAAFRSGWPVKIGLIDAGLLPDVGEGINGSPVVAPVTCPEGGGGLKIGVTPDAGPGYILNTDGSSCYGSSEGKYNALETDFSAGNGKVDTPAFPAVGEPSFGTLDGTTTNMFAPVAGLLRALDVIAPDYQKGSQDFTAAWNASTGQFAPGFPAVNNDLSFITGQAVGDITGEAPAQEVIAGTASQDLQAYDASGAPASPEWPKLTGDWLVATPVLGSLGTIDTAEGAKKNVVTVTRSGTLSVYSTPASACSPSSWPNFHHDIANSGDYTRDALAPGKPLTPTIASKVLSWKAPGNDLMCGTAAAYEIVTSASPITPQNFAAATPLSGAPVPAAAGTEQSYALPATAKRYVAVRAVDAAGNIGLPAVKAR
jgi:Subtilase family